MKAAVLHQFGLPPRYEDVPDPIPNERETMLHMRAAALKNIDRMMADGSHYDRHPELPAIVGIDGIGTLDDGTRVYCGGLRPPYGTMAERAAVTNRFFMPIPDDVDDLTAAALPNPALSSWLPLQWRAKLEPGETVLILGATGVAGRLAIQIAKHLGAGRVIGAGRNPESLHELRDLGADAVISLDQDDDALHAAFIREGGEHGYDIVLDYLWGHPTEVLVEALTGHDVMARTSRTRLVQIGEMAGATIQLPASALRSSALEIYGSGGGSIPHEAIFETFPRLWEAAASGHLRIDCEAVPLADVERAWIRPQSPGKRLVFVP